ncbi:hypothetical protein [Billgrantia kenyensis]|uniref:Uncharacterized protein n=1 Tax=Billgrantia kenyensis TaxID=321266 RepID=A0A7V9W3K8_9GAMM|nr:hypothetical protein [Halomonas kenyensis]MBA2780438.1 hypothetical protein [Halomonas kenyensis]MCG6663354.1 hypothetical protein [Halomonas kenyensis]
MADLDTRMNAVKEGIARLAALAAPEHQREAGELAEAMTRELDSAIAEAGAKETVHDTASPMPRGPRHEEIRCPVCSLRSFRFQKGTLRRSEDSNSGFEAFFHCLSCGHEAWHEAL